MKKSRNIKDVSHLFPKIKEYLQKVYSDRLEAVIIYGSFAKNKATEDSDVDIAVILKGDVNPSVEIDRVNNFISDLGLEYNELITIFPVSLNEIKNSIWPLYKSLQRDGIPL